MKKLIFAAILAISATSVFAQTGSIGVQAEHEARHNASSLNSVAFVPSMAFGDTVVDAKLEGARTSNGVTGDSIEIGATRSVALPYNVTGSVRAAIGKSFVTGASASFYEVEPKLAYPLTSQLALNTSYRYTNSFDTGRGFRSNTVYVGADYAVSKVDTVGVKLFRETGDTRGRGLQAAYTRSF